MSVNVAVDGAILVVEIDRPDAMNALDPAALESLAAAWARLDADDDLRVGVVTGAGDQSFCAGADLRETVPHLVGEEQIDVLSRALLVGGTTRTPVIAAVNGFCLGGGLVLLVGTDIRLASATATFGSAAARMGLYPVGGIPSLVRQLPYAVVADLVLNGTRFSAEEAHRLGLVSSVHPPERLLDEAMSTAHRLAQADPTALRAMKESLATALRPTPEAVELDRRLAVEVLRGRALAAHPGRPGP